MSSYCVNDVLIELKSLTLLLDDDDDEESESDRGREGRDLVHLVYIHEGVTSYRFSYCK